MKDYIKIKEKLLQGCIDFVESRLKTIVAIIESNKKALQSETKSSVGDKHETGRAMLQLEMEKAGQQLSSINQMKGILQKIPVEFNPEIVALGSVVITDKVNYYLAISAGKITLKERDYYAVSADSPIGKQLLGKRVGDQIPFNKAKILEII